MNIRDVPGLVRRRLDSPYFWLILAYLGLVIVGVFSWDIRSDSIQRDAGAVASRIAEKRATAEAAYQRCLASIPSSTRANKFLDGVEALADVLVLNARLTLVETSRDGGDLLRLRRENAERLQYARRAIGAIRPFPVPTRQECRDRRKEALR